jgi:hypothetical protein
MLIGKHFRLTRPTVGIQLVEGTARVLTVPSNAIIRVLSGPNSNGALPAKGLVYILWEEKTVAIFAIDVEQRGIEVKQIDRSPKGDKSATA